MPKTLSLVFHALLSHLLWRPGVQIVETEHLLKALLEQPNGLARRILAKAGANPSHLLEKVDQYIRRQPKVSGDANQVGPPLSAFQCLDTLAASPPPSQIATGEDGHTA